MDNEGDSRSQRGLRTLRVLFDAGILAGLPDDQLLNRFARGEEGQSEHAFAALVDRHGPMVLRTCQGILGDEHEAQDAFQTTFLVLARKSRMLWVRDSLGPWLHRVACRAAMRAKKEAGRRRMLESWAARRIRVERDGDSVEIQEIIHGELDRLPDRYRGPVVLCDLEGHTYEHAAQQLGCPIGTLRSRLARARSLLKDRLERRGFANSGLFVAFGPPVPTTPASLARDALAVVTGHGKVPPASIHVIHLTRGVLKTMFFSRLKYAAGGLLLTGLAVMGTFVAAQGGSQPVLQEVVEPSKPSTEAPVSGSSKIDAIRQALVEARPAADAIADLYARSTALRRVGNVQIRAGDLAEAQVTLRLAEQVAEKIAHERNRAFALDRVAIALARAGDIAESRKTFALLVRESDARSPNNQVECRATTSMSQNMAGLHDDALATLKDALRVMEEMDDEAKAAVAVRVIHAQSEVGDFAGALALTGTFQGAKSNMQANFLRYIARGCAKADRKTAVRYLTEALELSREITYPYPRAWAQQAIAEHLAEVGEIATALALVHVIGNGDPDPSMSQDVIPEALVAIAVQQAKAGDNAAARRTLNEAFAFTQTMPNGVSKSWKLHKIIESQANVGDLDAALENVVTLADDSVEAIPALVAIARRQLHNDERPKALATLHAALDAVKRIRIRTDMIGDDIGRNTEECLRGIAIALAEAGEVEEAVACIQSRGSESWRAMLLAELAPFQARRGNIEGALRTALSIKDGIQKGEALAGIAREQAKAGDEAAAIAWASKLEPPDARVSALAGVADGLTERRKRGEQVKPKSK